MTVVGLWTGNSPAGVESQTNAEQFAILNEGREKSRPPESFYMELALGELQKLLLGELFTSVVKEEQGGNKLSWGGGILMGFRKTCPVFPINIWQYFLFQKEWNMLSSRVLNYYSCNHSSCGQQHMKKVAGWGPICWCQATGEVSRGHPKMVVLAMGVTLAATIIWLALTAATYNLIPYVLL